MPAAIVGEVAITGEGGVRAFKRPSERIGALRDCDEVDVVAHQAVRLDVHAVFFSVAREQAQIGQPVRIIIEDGTAAVASLGDVVGHLEHSHASDTGHLVRKCVVRQRTLQRIGN
jgi:hypothetical protein